MTRRRLGLGLALLVTILSAALNAQQLSDDTTVRVRIAAADPGVRKQSLEVRGYDVLWADAALSLIHISEPTRPY